MNKWNKRVNLFIKKYTNIFMIVSAALILAGFFVGRVMKNNLVMSIFFIISTVLCGFPILFKAITGLKMKAVGIEVLVSIAVIGAFVIGEYSEGAIVTFLFQFGTFLEQKTLKKTRGAIKKLTQMAPDTALRLDNPNAEPEEIEADEVEEKDLLLVRTGAKIAVDGVITYGEGYINEASITGEATTVHKIAGNNVFAGTILDSGLLQMEATKVGEDTTFAKIIALIEEAQDAKSPVERFIDRFAKSYTPMVVVMAILVYIFTRNLDMAITVLVLACPGALIIGAPVANVAGIGKGAKQQILLKGGDSITTYAKTDVFVFDKTGTLTIGHPEVTSANIYAEDKNKTLKIAGLIEKNSDHPLAKAIVNYVKAQGILLDENITTQTIKGMGLIAEIEGHKILVGNERLLINSGINIENTNNINTINNINNINSIKQLQNQIDEIKKKGGSVVLVAEDENIIALFGISDQIRLDAAKMLQALKKNGIKKTIMLTGDNEQTAKSVASQIAIDEVRAELLPEKKLLEIQKLQKDGYIVAFVGDGVNDSPAIAMADTGIAVGSGTDVAIETSDVVLMKEGLDSVTESFRLAKKTVNILWQNIFIAVGTVILLLIGLLVGYIHMASGMFIHEASILVVILNAMRLLYKK